MIFMFALLATGQKRGSWTVCLPIQPDESGFKAEMMAVRQ
ncbi:hypothetical protein EZJ58_5007 [Sodalis ligni]|uniref:Uncharacterized protein n=1 Tax=Sodalis ligni TaxID=2697027 RepID=A0A4V2Q3H3_9GAMM|nr:hypothetical protein EZJ58_5007 [Sodalis ligni]